MRDLKSGSSSWIKERDPDLSAFGWQAGYGAFSVEATNVERIRAYVARQEDHHRHISFQDEYRQILREHGLEWDERYVWD